MVRLEFCTDENVPRAFVTALASNGFDVIHATEERGEDTVDESLLQWTASDNRVLVTNDRDFAELHTEHDHAGIAVYSNQSLTPGEFVTAIRRIDRQLSPESVRNELIWLDSWTQ
jgi:predicted nuclease of predicted toxin-antitoxin system